MAHEGFVVFAIQEVHIGDTRLHSVRFVQIFWWPGAIHAGNGIRQMILYERPTSAQREVLVAFDSGVHGGKVWEIFAAVSAG